MIDLMDAQPLADVGSLIVNIFAVIRGPVFGAKQLAGIDVFVGGAITPPFHINTTPLEHFIGGVPQFFAYQRRDRRSILVLIYEPVLFRQKLLTLIEKCRSP